MVGNFFRKSNGFGGYFYKIGIKIFPRKKRGNIAFWKSLISVLLHTTHTLSTLSHMPTLRGA